MAINVERVLVVSVTNSTLTYTAAKWRLELRYKGRILRTTQTKRRASSILPAEGTKK
jgi:hypothetical protein